MRKKFGLPVRHLSKKGCLTAVPAESTTGHIATGSRRHRQASRRVRHKLKVYERRLNRRVNKPATQIIDRYPVHQQVPCVAVAQRVGSDPLAWCNSAQRQAVAGWASTLPAGALSGLLGNTLALQPTVSLPTGLLPIPLLAWYSVAIVSSSQAWRYDDHTADEQQLGRWRSVL